MRSADTAMHSAGRLSPQEIGALVEAEHQAHLMLTEYANKGMLWQVRQKITKSSAGRWRNYERFIGPLRGLLELSL